MSSESSQWIALIHTPLPDVEGSVFEDPRFAYHRDFLQSMIQREWLVAAGPFANRDAQGMTVLRVPNGQQENAIELARADRSVTEGLFAIDVRPWNVVAESAVLDLDA